MNVAAIFAELGRRLERFGATAPGREVVARAHAANGWFRPAEVVAAVGALRGTMLRRELLEPWLARYGVPVARPRDVGVVMAGNIPLVGFLDMLCVVASGHRCHFKPSSKDSVLMEHVAGLLLDIEPGLPLFRLEEGQRLDAVIATGSDNTNRYFRSRYGGIPSLLRGSRSSLAVLTGGESDDELRALGDDIFTYSGLGCRSVSLLFLPRGYDAERLARILGEGREPNPKYRNNWLRTRALRLMRGERFVEGAFFIMSEARDFPVELSCINYTFCDSPEEAAAWAAARAERIQCIAGRGFVPFGQTQRPALGDWPDGRDVLEFLAAL